MFPTSGYFKNIPCPYFALSVCERPNCHFKHQKPSSIRRAHESVASTSHNKPSHLYGTGTSSSKSTNSIEKPLTTKSKRLASYRAAVLPRPHYQHDPFPTGPSTLVYKPTPISELNKSSSPGSASSTSAATAKSADSSDALLSPIEDEIIHRPTSQIAKTVTHRLSVGSENGQGDGNPGKDESDLIIPMHSDMDDTREAYLSKDIQSDRPSPPLQTETVQQHTGTNSEVKTSLIDRHAKAKRAISKQELEEFADLFGEASDEEVVNDGAGTSTLSDDDDVVAIEVTEKAAGPVIDLTADSSDDEAASNQSFTTAGDLTEPLNTHVKKLNVSDKIDSTSKPCETRDIKSSNKPSSSSGVNSKGKKSKHKSKHKDMSKIGNEKDSSKNENHKHSSNKCKKSDINDSSCGENSRTQTALPLVVSASNEADQCKELFAMFQRSDPEPSMEITAPDIVIPESESRKRKARDGAEYMAQNQPVKKKSGLPSARQTMQARFDAMKETKEHQKLQHDKAAPLMNGSSTHRKPDYNSVVGMTASRTYKGLERKAHQPVSKKVKKSLVRPRIPPNAKSKVSAGIRQLKLDMIIDECLKLYPDEKDAFTRAQKEEEQASSRAGNRIIYANLISNIIKKLRDEMGGAPSSKTSTLVSHDKVLAGRAGDSITVGLKRKASIHLTKEDMHGDLLFKKLRPYVMTEAQLVEHGFPRPDPARPGQAIVQWSSYDKQPENKSHVRTCKRCGKNFRLTAGGGYVTKDECVYHWGKSFQTRVHGTVDFHFSCCQGKPGAEGCTINYGHVHESNKFEDLNGYMKTFAKKSKDYCGVYSLDCEMVYTTRGLEIARVTVIDDRLDIMFDSFIKPTHEIIDYNTRFSGLTEENFRNVDTTLKDVQAILLDMFQEDTVLIGHSLNSDFIALKLIHDNVVDTSLVWPHKHGLPYKRALKSLMLDILNKLIQEAGSAGHDSSEDASACMELMRWKVHQDFLKDNR